METPSDSDQSRRERRKTAADIFFEEEPVFSDSEEEAEFLRLTFGPCEEYVSPPEPQLSNSLLERILEACCRECICCQRIRLLINPLEKSLAPLQDCSTPVDKQQNSSKESNALVPSNQIGTNSNLDDKAKTKRRKRKSLHTKRAQQTKLSNSEQLTDNTEGNKTVRRILDYDTENLENRPQESVVKLKTRKGRHSKRVSKGKRKSMPGETVPNGLVAKHKSAPSKKLKSIYSMIDKRVFKMTIDSTADRGFVNAITRKLARNGGVSSHLDSSSIQNTSFRLQATQKMKKLYSPTGWLNSPLFEKICKYDM